MIHSLPTNILVKIPFLSSGQIVATTNSWQSNNRLKRFLLTLRGCFWGERFWARGLGLKQSIETEANPTRQPNSTVDFDFGNFPGLLDSFDKPSLTEGGERARRKGGQS